MKSLVMGEVRDVEIQLVFVISQVSVNIFAWVKNKNGTQHRIRKAIHFWCHVGSRGGGVQVVVEWFSFYVQDFEIQGSLW